MPDAGDAPLLEVCKVEVAYGKRMALAGVSLQAQRGETIAVVGANGAGKSSLIGAICGLVRMRAGAVRLAGVEVTRWPSHRIFASGVACVPEGRQLIAGLSVAENIALAAPNADFAELSELLPGIARKLDVPAGRLSGGEAQMVAIARALACKPQVLLLDEPSLGLAPRMVAEVFSILHRLKGHGLAIVLVEQNVRLALQASQRAYLIEQGQIHFAGEAHALLADEALMRAHMGLLPAALDGA